MEVTLNVISGKWKPSILSCLFRGPHRPKDLQMHNPDATGRVISHQLKQLEEDGIIAKKIYDEVPLRVEYFLTVTGESLLPVVKALSEWGENYQTIKNAFNNE